MTGRLLRILGALVVGAMLVAGGFWAGRTALAPPADPSRSPGAPQTYTVVEGMIGREVEYTAVASWPLDPVTAPVPTGRVTSVDTDTTEVVRTGDVVLTVDLRPVMVAEGAVPMFRDLAVGARGADVEQLQRMLAQLGLHDGPVDGRFGNATARAVEAFQRERDVEPTGVVPQGQIIFAPRLPARILPAAELRVGAVTTGLDTVVSVVAEQPELVVPLSAEQAAGVPPDAAADVRVGDRRLAAVAATRVSRDDGGVDLVLAFRSGTTCDGACREALPVGQQTRVPVGIEIVPEVTGPVVPVSAVASDGVGGTTVTTADGDSVPVVVVATSEGVAVVEGVDEGTTLRLPFVAPQPRDDEPVEGEAGVPG